ncbi:MAG: magnesium transporter [Lachnospiraceae bacterium]|jgi:magnesium transporter
MEKEQMIEELERLLRNHDLTSLRAMLTQIQPVDLADIFEQVPEETRLVLFRILPKDQAADTFAEMDHDEQEQLLTNFTDQEVKNVLNEMYTDDAVDMLEEMPAGFVRRVLSKATPDTRADINALLKYPEGSAGAVMTTEYVSLKATMSISEALRWIRAHGDDREDVYTCYVTDANRKLNGVLTVRDMLLCKRDAYVSELMEKNIISVKTTDDREVAAQQLARYDLNSLPVVDGENRLVGIITVDDAIDVLQQETTEDFQKIAGTTPSEEPYLKTPAWKMAGHRIVWLLVLMISDMISGGILESFESALTALPVLITFIPMLTDTGGNAGSQASTLVIRGLALHEIRVRDLPRVLWKEFRVAIICGTVLAAFNFVRLSIQYPGQQMVAITVAVAMLFTVVMAKAIGGVLPIIATKLKLDPALMASPLITTIVDAASLLIYLNVAKTLLHI